MLLTNGGQTSTEFSEHERNMPRAKDIYINQVSKATPEKHLSKAKLEKQVTKSKLEKQGSKAKLEKQGPKAKQEQDRRLKFGNVGF
jgi:hypothetical protein